jgi:hypothetical protein
VALLHVADLKKAETPKLGLLPFGEGMEGKNTKGAEKSGRGRQGLVELDRFVQRFAEVFQPTDRYHDGIETASDFLGDAEEATADVLAQVKLEMFSFDPEVDLVQVLIRCVRFS